MSNTKMRRNIFLVITAVILTGAIFTGCGRNGKTENECGKTEIFADDLQKGNAAFEAKDYETAVKYFMPAAEQGIPEAQFKLGICYHEGIEQDYKEAVNWLRKAAEQGYTEAQSSLGFCYDYGDGVNQDSTEAVKWYRKAAEQGLAKAQANLGMCYEKGEGVKPDKTEAIKWLRKAAEQDITEEKAKAALKRLGSE